MGKRLFILTVILLTACNSARTHGNTALTKEDKISIKETRLFQDELQLMIRKVHPATVAIITHELLAGVRGMFASGVSVSAEGLIITAGHMVIPGGDYTIIYPDGKKVPAMGLGKIETLDLGLLKITEKGEYPFVEMGYSSSLKVGDPCFSLAYPGSFNSKLAARLGKVASLKDGQFGFLRTTCLMESGDSGGPVFDMKGRLIGIRSYIGMSLDENYDVPIDFHREYWTALQEAVKYRFYPDKDIVDYPQETPDFLTFDETAFKKGMNKPIDFVCTISSKGIRSEKNIQGFVINLDGVTSNRDLIANSYVLSKSSEILNNPIVTVGEKTFEDVEILYRDFERDLVLLNLKSRLKNAIDIQDIMDENIQDRDMGTILFSPVSHGEGVISIVGSAAFELPGKYSAGYLGTKVVLEDGKNIVALIRPNTPAAESSLSVGDEVISINGIKIEEPATLIGELGKSKPYDVISLVRKKNGLIDTLQIELKSRPFEGTGHLAEEFADGRSERRDGFEKIFIHDARLKPSECGGPIVGVNGKVLGINMARYSRTSSLGLSGKEIRRFLKKSLD